MAPLRRATATALAKEITHRIIYRHGCPSQLISDNGTQFTSRQFRALLSSFGIKHRTSPVYAPHCNPVERANRTIKTMIGQYVGTQHRDWDERINALQFALNTARHEATGYTPAFLIHGRELAPPHPTERPPIQNPITPELHRQRLEEAFEVARIHLARAFQRQERHYNLRRRDWRPRLGEVVWKRERPLSSRSDAFNAKLAPRFAGPMEIRRIISPVIVDLRDRHGKWHRHVHIQDLKTQPPTPGNLQDNEDE